jgi:hypothetical protein
MALLLATSLACALPSFNSTPTPPPSPTPEGDTLVFNAPYSIQLEPGTVVPGTRIVFVNAGNDLYEMSIDGLQAYLPAGNSITWRGVVAPGLFSDYQLRLRRDFRGRLLAEGEVRVAVLNPAPVEIPPTQTPSAPIHYSQIQVSYFVPEGYRIPGTTLIYEGEQNGVAELSGTASYPFFAPNDTLLWTGKLRPNITIRYNLRVSNLDQYGLALSGTAELWATQ